MNRVIVCMVLVLVVSLPAVATTFIVPDDPQLIAKSQGIVIASVQDLYGRWTTSNHIETVYALAVEHVFKGPLTAGLSIRVTSPGGMVDGQATIVEGAAHFAVGERALLFLTYERDHWEVTDWAVGRFRFTKPAGGEELLVRDDDDIIGWDVDGTPHKGKSRAAEKFLRFIEDEVAGRRPSANYFVAPQDRSASVLQRVQTEANVYPSYTYTTAWSNGSPGRWATSTMANGIVVYKNASQNISGQSDGGVGAIITGLSVWTNDCPSAINLIYGGTTTATHNGSDQRNVVVFNDPNGEITGSTSTSGIIAVTFSGPAGAYHTFDGRTDWISLTDKDIVFNDGFSGANSQFQVAMTHELGHLLGFRHSDQHWLNAASSCDSVVEECSTYAIMNHSAISALGTSPQTWDLNAARLVYPGGVCGTATVRIRAISGGQAYSGAVNYNVEGPNGISGAVVPNDISFPSGVYMVEYIGGGPSGGTFSSITPAAIQSVSPGGTITFTLNFTSNCTDPYEPNNGSLQSYGPISSGTAYHGLICDSSDVDWFKVSLTAGQTATFTLSVPSGVDYDMELYDPSWVAGSYGVGAAETFTYTATFTGTYYIRILGAGGSFSTTASYSLMYSVGNSNCTSFTINSSSSNPTYQSGSASVTVTGSPAGCTSAWSAFGNGSWLTVNPAGGNGTGSTTVSWSQNPSTTSRSDYATVAGRTFTVNQGGAPGACSYSISPQSASGAGSGGSGNIQVTGSPSPCVGSWSASSGGFISLTGLTSGNGAGTWQVPYSYGANPSTTSTRQATVTFTGAFPSGGVFTLTQDAQQTGSCTYAISPMSANGTGNGGSGNIQVTGSPSPCTGSWSASSGGFITLTGLASGSGAGTWQVPYSYGANPSTTSSRQGTVNFSGSFPSGGTFTLTQAPSNTTNLPNLRPYQPAGWSGSIVVSNTSGTSADSSPLAPGDTLYIDWAVLNDGSVSAASGVTIRLLVDGAVVASWLSNTPLDPNYYFFWQDYPLGSLPSGTHTITIEADSTNAVLESDESDNQYTKTISIGGARTFADFNADHKSDILWYHAGTGQTYLWTMSSYTPLTMGSVNFTSDLNWKIAGIGDFNGDGKADVVWRHAVTGQNYMWIMDGGTIIGAGTVNWTTDSNWKIVGTADYNGDGKDDILWRNAATGQNYLYLMNGISLTTGGPLSTVADTGWKIVGSGDLNGDGKADIVWRHGTTGDTYAWLMNGFTTVGAGMIATVPDQNWTIIAVADFNGDGKADVFWRNAATGENYLYLMNGPSVASADWVNVVDDPNWKIVAVADYNGDGKADVVWRNAVTGENYLYLMDGFSIVTGTYLPQVPDAGWTVVR